MTASRENTVNVPVEPTEAMIEAAEAHWLRGGTGGWSRDNPRGIWSAMLSAAPSHEREGEPGGWIEWSGGENPVPGERVEVRFEIGGGADKASDDLRWTYNRGGYDIIAYRIVPTPGGEGE